MQFVNLSSWVDITRNGYIRWIDVLTGTVMDEEQRKNRFMDEEKTDS